MGLDDDFFALGGNSLVATQVVSRLSRALDTRVPVRELFEASTVEALAARLTQQAGGMRKALTARPRPERIPLSLAQQRMWFLNRFDTESTAYNIPLALRMSGNLDVAALDLALADVTERHESLRTVFRRPTTAPRRSSFPRRTRGRRSGSSMWIRTTYRPVACTRRDPVRRDLRRPDPGGVVPHGRRRLVLAWSSTTSARTVCPSPAHP